VLQRLGCRGARAGFDLRFEQAVVDALADGEQGLPVGLGEQATDSEVVAVVDGGLGAEGAAFLQVLLDLRGFVVDLEPGRVVAVEDPGVEATGGGGDDPAGEDDGDALGPAEGELVAERLLEPQPARLRAVEDARVGELELAEGQLVAVAALAVLGGEGRGQDPLPAAEEGPHVAGRQARADWK